MELTELKGIGEKTEKLFGKIGVQNVRDLLEFFPRGFETFSEPVTIAELGCKTFAAVRGCFVQAPFTRTSGGRKITTAVFKDEAGGSIRAVWFNAPFVKNSIRPGELCILRGRISHKYNTPEFNQPRIFGTDEYNGKLGTLIPVYSLTKGISNALMIKVVKQACKTPEFTAAAFDDCIPAAVRQDLDLADRAYAIKNMHFPENEEAFAKAAQRMAFEEIFVFILSVKTNENRAKKASGFLIGNDKRTDDLFTALPFELTSAQKRVIADIGTDLSSGLAMNRLIQGDVGSGKTIVALSAMLNTAYSGFQAALMTPTEVLARQHYETISGFLKEKAKDVNAVLLTGSMSRLEKQVVYDAIELGRADIIIGTHAIFQEKVVYKNLALVITDEQHRFGIKQREELSGKGRLPHVLVMSATPIPRTLALVLYGNMDISVIDELPKNRKPVKNAVIDDSMKPNAYRLIEREARAGHQAYVICPLIEFSDGIDAQNVEDCAAMLKDVFGGDIQVAALHGRLGPVEKNRIMENFAAGKIQVLVSTTVVEVGVDAPNATVMMIEDADRFGLAALHQLRGRVGRGEAQSYCIFVCNKKSGGAKERLEILKTSNDGFEIAEKDLSMRGPGEFLGMRQSGRFGFRNFDPSRDSDIAMKALAAADGIISGETCVTPAEEELLRSRIRILRSGITL